MRRRPLVRATYVTVAISVLIGACTSDPDAPDPTVERSPSVASSASTPPVSPEAGPFEISSQRVRLGAPQSGSFHVRAVYPWSPSRCVRPYRPSLDARYPGAISIRTADDGTLTVTVTISFREYLEGIAEVPPTWPKAALEAQVIAARSYVLSRTGWSGAEGEDLENPICATSDC